MRAEDLTPEQRQEILTSHRWIKVKRWVDDETLPVEKRFEALKIHHEEETGFLIDFVRGFVKTNEYKDD